MLHFSDWPDEQLVRLDAEGKVIHDAFINGVKEADFLRNGTGKGIMALSKEDSTTLWQSVMERMFFPSLDLSDLRNHLAHALAPLKPFGNRRITNTHD